MYAKNSQQRQAERVAERFKSYFAVWKQRHPEAHAGQVWAKWVKWKRVPFKVRWAMTLKKHAMQYLTTLANKLPFGWCVGIGREKRAPQIEFKGCPGVKCCYYDVCSILPHGHPDCKL